MAMSRYIRMSSLIDATDPTDKDTAEVTATKTAEAARRKKLAKLESLASLPVGFKVHDEDIKELAPAVSAALETGMEQLAAVKALVDEAKKPGTKKVLEELEEDPDQARLNLQLALDRLVSDESIQALARTDGIKFQTRYNLTNDQMLTLCRLAVDVGAYKNTEDLNKYMDAFKNLDPALKGLSPGALAKLGLSKVELDGLIGSCSCCCP